MEAIYSVRISDDNVCRARLFSIKTKESGKKTGLHVLLFGFFLINFVIKKNVKKSGILIIKFRFFFARRIKFIKSEKKDNDNYDNDEMNNGWKSPFGREKYTFRVPSLRNNRPFLGISV